MKSHNKMMDIMIENDFLYNLPKECLVHMCEDCHPIEEATTRGSEGGYDWCYEEKSDNVSECFIPLLWMYYNFYKETRKQDWNKDTTYLLGEIMWLLIQDGELTNESYEKKIMHKKEKGIKRTSFNEAKRKLIYNGKGKPWQGKKQEKIGNIIYERCNGSIILSDEWEQCLCD